MNPFARTQLSVILGVLVLAPAMLVGCDDVVTAQGLTGAQMNQCSNGAAFIFVRDGFYEHFCGCDESAAAGQTPQVPITCTIPLGSTVEFLFQGAALRHEIVPVGTPAIFPSGVYDPDAGNKSNPNDTYLLKPAAVGTYQFSDDFFPNMTGQIVVR